MKNLVSLFEATMTTVFGDAKENLPAEGIAGLSTPEKLIGRCEHSGITTPAKKRMRTNSLPLSAIPVWRPEPSNIWTKVTKEYTAKYNRSGVPLSCPPSPVEFRIGQKRRHQDNHRCPCKRPFLDLSKMCETSYIKVSDRRRKVIIPKGLGLDIISLYDEPDTFSIRPIQAEGNCLLEKDAQSSGHIDLDSMERD